MGCRRSQFWTALLLIFAIAVQSVGAGLTSSCAAAVLPAETDGPRAAEDRQAGCCQTRESTCCTQERSCCCAAGVVPRCGAVCDCGGGQPEPATPVDSQRDRQVRQVVAGSTCLLPPAMRQAPALCGRAVADALLSVTPRCGVQTLLCVWQT